MNCAPVPQNSPLVNLLLLLFLLLLLPHPHILNVLIKSKVERSKVRMANKGTFSGACEAHVACHQRGMPSFLIREEHTRCASAATTHRKTSASVIFGFRHITQHTTTEPSLAFRSPPREEGGRGGFIYDSVRARRVLPSLCPVACRIPI